MPTGGAFEKFIGGFTLAAMTLGVCLVAVWVGAGLAGIAGWIKPAPYSFVASGSSLILGGLLLRFLLRARG